MGEYGSALTDRLLTAAECREIAALYQEPGHFRTTVDMARHRFGSGQYRYFTHDLPKVVRELREAFYPRLLPIARDWAATLRPMAGHASGVGRQVPRGRAVQVRADPAAVRPR